MADKKITELPALLQNQVNTSTDVLSIVTPNDAIKNKKITVQALINSAISTSSFATTGSNTFEGNQFINNGGITIISGGLDVQDIIGKVSIEAGNRWLYDVGGSSSIAWSNRQLYDDTETTSLNWQSRQLLDDTGNSSVLTWGGESPEFFGTSSWAVSASWAPSSGGGGNTGDITFNGIQIIGAGTASGDGNGYATLELVPDVNLYGNDQYIIVDPTQPSHIHLRAGGTQDDSSAELYLGGELNYVKVVDGNGVRLNNAQFAVNFYQVQQSTEYDDATWSTDESNNHWIDINITNPSSPTRPTTPFNVPFNSLTQYPQNSIEVFDGTNYIDVYSNGQAYTLGNPYQLRIGTTEAPPVNPTSLSSLTFRINTLIENTLNLEDNNLDLYVTNDVTIYANQTVGLYSGDGKITITANDNNTAPRWEFQENGSLLFPDETVQTTAYAGMVLPTTLPATLQTGSMYFSGSFIYVYDGLQYRSASLN